MKSRVAPLVFVGTVLVVAHAMAAGPGSAPDHYLCYKAVLAKGQAKFPKGVTKSLADRFGGPQTFDVKKITAICNPATRDGSVVSSPTVHLEGFAVKAQKGAPRFVKSDRVAADFFGTRTLTVTGTITLLDVTPKVLGTTPPAPFAADPTIDPAINRFKCYQAKLAKGSPKLVVPAPPTVTDELFLGGQTLIVKKIVKLCVPVDKDGETPGAASRPSALVCYAVKPTKGAPRFARTTVATNDENFAPHVLVATALAELCMPAVEPTAAASPTPTVTPSPTPTVTLTGTSTLSPTPSATRSATPTVSPPPTPTSSPSPAAGKRVFVTSTTTTGGFGGVNGADAFCAGRATAAGLVGTFKAWVSVSGDGPSTRFAQSAGPYILIGGTVIANSWTDLVDGTLAHAINVDENGTTIGASEAWTATTSAGAPTALNCNNFLNATGSVFGVCGSASATNGAWTNSSTPACNVPLRVYCFEQ